MDTTEKIIELINSSDMNTFQKNMAIGFIQRAKTRNEEKQDVISLVKEVTREKNMFEISFSNEEFIVYKIMNGKDEWEVKYPFRAIYKKDNRWLMVNTVAPSFDAIYLCYLGQKQLGANSQFVVFAMKMLEMKEIE